jgi:hypothetical protein
MTTLLLTFRNAFRRCEHPVYANWLRAVRHGEHDSFEEYIAKLGYDWRDLTNYEVRP